MVTRTSSKPYAKCLFKLLKFPDYRRGNCCAPLFIPILLSPGPGDSALPVSLPGLVSSHSLPQCSPPPFLLHRPTGLPASGHLPVTPSLQMATIFTLIVNSHACISSPFPLGYHVQTPPHGFQNTCRSHPPASLAEHPQCLHARLDRVLQVPACSSVSAHAVLSHILDFPTSWLK